MPVRYGGHCAGVVATPRRGRGPGPVRSEVGENQQVVVHRDRGAQEYSEGLRGHPSSAGCPVSHVDSVRHVKPRGPQRTATGHADWRRMPDSCIEQWQAERSANPLRIVLRERLLPVTIICSLNLLPVYLIFFTHRSAPETECCEHCLERPTENRSFAPRSRCTKA